MATQECKVSIYHEIQAEIRKAQRETEYLALAEDSTRKMPYEHLRDIFREGINEINRLEAHDHKWDDDEICYICGADGRVA